VKAVCQRCGADKPGPLVPCRVCSHVPTGEERTIAWLLSDHHLSPRELERAASRIRAGERLAPPEELLARARQGLEEAIPGRRRRPRAEAIPAAPMGGEDDKGVSAGDSRDEPTATWISAPSLSALLELDAAGPPGGGLPRWALAAFAAAGVLLTPLPAWVAWWLWREVAPRAARQVFAVAWVTTAAMLALWLGVMAWAWSGRLP
jgi:hypothetical protein